MAVPKKKRSHTKTAKRRSHLALSKADLGSCPECGLAQLPHRLCKCQVQAFREGTILVPTLAEKR